MKFEVMAKNPVTMDNALRLAQLEKDEEQALKKKCKESFNRSSNQS